MRLINADDLVKIFHREGNSDAWGGEFIRRTIEEQPAIETVPLEDYRSMEQTVHKLTQAIAEAEPIKHGCWVYIRDEENNGLYECSECHKGDIHAKTCKVPYCWNCGAKMDLDEAKDPYSADQTWAEYTLKQTNEAEK